MSIVVKQRPTTSPSTHHHHYFSPIPACFRRSISEKRESPVDAPPATSTSVYATDFGACVLTWTRTLLGRTLRIQLQGDEHRCSVDHTIKIRSNPLLFWRSQGSKTVEGVQILWDFGRGGFGSGTEPEAEFYLAVLVSGEVAVLVGDVAKAEQGRLKLGSRSGKRKQRLVLRKEHVSGTRFYRATATIGGGKKVRILIEHFDTGLRFSFNGFRALEVERLVWKFRGKDQVEVDGVVVSVSWDVHGWLFGEAGRKKKRGEGGDACGVFVFDFEKVVVGGEDRMGRSESVSLSSISSSGSSWGSSNSVLDWWSVEEKEMECGGGGFSLVVYASKC
uniref:Uncharacterized protein n=1 Tax=Kalanchoe fedtschenkoi TaxID=63787 RepID=A0A7N0TCD9_KALFE